MALGAEEEAAADLGATPTISSEEDPTSPISRSSSTSPVASRKGTGRTIQTLVVVHSPAGMGCADAPQGEGRSDEAAAAVDPLERDHLTIPSVETRTMEAAKRMTLKEDPTISASHRTRALGLEASSEDRRTIPRSLEGHRPTCGRTPTRAEAAEDRLGAGVGSLPPGSGSLLHSGGVLRTGDRIGTALRRSAGGQAPEATT